MYMEVVLHIHIYMYICFSRQGYMQKQPVAVPLKTGVHKHGTISLF